MLRKQLDVFSKMDLAEVDINHLTDITCVKIDGRKEMIDRIKSFLEQVSNPYLFKNKKISIKLEFLDEGPDLEVLIANYFRNNDLEEGGNGNG